MSLRCNGSSGLSSVSGFLIIGFMTGFTLLGCSLTYSQETDQDPDQQATKAESPSTDSAQEQKPKLSKTKAISEALSLATMGFHQRAMELLQDLNAQLPNDLEVKVQLLNRIRQRSNQLVRAGNKVEGYALYKLTAKLAREIAEDLPDDKRALIKKRNSALIYNEACAYAVDGDNARCLASLREALAWGFDNYNHLLNDHDLAEIADSDEFKTILGENLANFKTKMREAAQKSLEGFKPIEFDVELPDVDGRLVSVSDYRGKILVLTFWSTGNPVSRDNLELLTRVHRNYSGRDLEILAIGCERTSKAEEATATIKKYLSEHELPFTCLVAGPRVRIEMKKNQGFPVTMILDKEGKARVAFAGRQRYYVIATIADLLLEQSDQAKIPQ